jgi:hypothetical protein
MESSRFIQISPEILIEYIYTSQSAPPTFSTATYPIELMRDTQTEGTYFFNTDSVSATMGNYRDISAVPNNKARTQYVSLDTSLSPPYNDSVTFLTDSANLLQTFSPDLLVEYDKVKIYFVAGFNFTGFDGMVFEVLAPRRDGVMMNLASINFLKGDTATLIADPLLLADKLYSTYIEWRVPSLYYMNEEDETSTNSLTYKLTEGQGFLGSPAITLRASGIYQTIVDNAYSFYEMQEINSVSILNRDAYDNLYAQVIESTNGDYYELSGEVAGSSFSQLISELNSQGDGNYIVFHEISVTEQVGSVFTQTSFQVFTQTVDFDLPILFRPIIKNANTAVSFSINYVLRLYNLADNTQIIKNARLTSFDAQKYGRQMVQINLGVVPTVANVYNQINNDNGNQIVVGTGSTVASVDNTANTSEQIAEKLVVKTSYVTTFRDRLNIKAAITPVKIQTITESDGDTN